MYSFGNRKDTAIVDEPFYSYYLNKYQVEYHPGTQKIIDSLPTDAMEVIDKIIFAERQEEYAFIKNMAHHIQGFNHSFINEVRNIFLIRNPRELIASFSKVIEHPTGNDIGVEREKELYEEVLRNGNYPPIVIDSGEVLKDPKKVLKNLCERLDIPFSDEMLTWEAGPRKEDGVWAPYWYNNVHQSTEFNARPQKYVNLTDQLEDLYNEVKPSYEFLYKKSIKA